MQERYSSLIQRLSDAERAFALLIGIFFLFVGIAGFIPGFVTLPAEPSNVAVDVTNLTLFLVTLITYSEWTRWPST